MATTQEILDQLNGYTGENLWQDVILQLDSYDADATEGLPDFSLASDMFALSDGRVFRHSAGSYGGAAHSPHAEGWYEQS